jgi:N-acetylglucosamine malate deacetylase 1
MGKILVIAPHHDDEVIGCGGSIALHAGRGDLVYVVFVFAGWSGIIETQDKSQATNIIQAEAKKAGGVLGVTHITELAFMDREYYPDKNIIFSLIKALREINPEIVYFPHPEDSDREHKFVYEVAKEALWLSSSDYLPELGVKSEQYAAVLGYEVWKPIASPQFFRDITSVVGKKIEALGMYQSQMAVKDWSAASLGLNQYRGVTSGSGSFAEAFQIIRLKGFL